MTHDGAPPSPAPGSWDRLAEQLQQWRHRAGDPSYTEVAHRITKTRIQSGTEPAAARVGRTTVYDAFRKGRTRINLGLVREIGHALGAEDSEITAAIEAGRTPGQPSGSPAPPSGGPHRPGPAAPPPAAPPPTAPPPTRQVLLLMVGCVALNLMGREVVDFLHLPLYLDMVGTALAAFALGPWRGAAVGVTTNVVGVLPSGLVSLPFAVVNVLGALAWGYGIRRYAMGRTLPRFLGLNALVALVCTLVAVPILVIVYDGSMGHPQDIITGTIEEATHLFLVSVSFSNLVTSLADKVISGFVALVALSALPAAFARGVTMPENPLAGEQRHQPEQPINRTQQ